MSPALLPVVQDGLADDAHDFLCARCARRQQTCCQRTDIVLTTGDVGRIAAHVGHSNFIDYRPPGNADYADQDDDPLWRDATFRADGTRRVVRWQASGDCTFLGTSGCKLPGDVRPLICRLFPFEYDEQSVFPDPASGCPTHLLAPGVALFDAIGMNRTDAERWHAQLYAELREQLPARA